MKIATHVLLILVLSNCKLYGESNESPPPVPSQEVPEVLNKGPIHEAFAQPVDMNSQAGIIAPNEPPEPIAENPAAEKPKGSKYVWIPGYWGWEDDIKDYVWVSGCWRIPPANMSWIPGYWNKVPGGWQWVAGFWIPTSRADQIEYLPEPPAVTEVVPPATAATGDDIWVPPCYYWRENQYILRPGYWLTPQVGWVWVPSHYTWTPYGYVFVSGYWDHVPAVRGILYAPVYFPRHFYRPPGYAYSLSVVVDLGNLQFGLFSYPRYCHYFFGDYYSDFYIGLGIYPWFEFETRHTWYDPIFVYDRWHYRRTIPHWGRHIRQEFALRREDRNLRPPRTYRELERRLSSVPVMQRNNFRMVEPLRDRIENRNVPMKFSRMSSRQRESILSQTRQVDHLRQERRRIESRQLVPEGVQSQRTPSTPGRMTPERQPSEQMRSAAPGRTEIPSTTMPSRPSERMRSAAPGRTERPSTPMSGRSSEQMRSTTPGRTERPSMEGQSFGRQRYMERRNSERLNMPRSPITGRSSHGWFGARIPSRPDGERNLERGGGGFSRRGRGRR
jgi:hypothetical protein